MILEYGTVRQNMHMAWSVRSVEVQDEVRQAFGWSQDDDLLSAEGLRNVLHNHAIWSAAARNQTLHSLQAVLRMAQKVVIIGAAVGAEEVLQHSIKGTVFIAADGAVGALSSYDSLACVVSDFDGSSYLERAAAAGQTIVAHAHGDNQKRWEEATSRWGEFSTPPDLILSHQVNKVVEGMENFGGFTDGDRALCFALSLGVTPENIALIGFKTGVVGRWSGSTISELKLKKLEWMEQIVTELGFGRWIQ